MSILSVKDRLAKAIEDDARKMQGSHKHDDLAWTPNVESFRYKVFKGHKYAKMEEDSPTAQVIVYYIDGKIYITHHGQDRSKIYPLMKGVEFGIKDKY